MPSHYLNQWWLLHWCIYASFTLNELTNLVSRPWAQKQSQLLDLLHERCYFIITQKHAKILDQLYLLPTFGINMVPTSWLTTTLYGQVGLNQPKITVLRNGRSDMAKGHLGDISEASHYVTKNIKMLWQTPGSAFIKPDQRNPWIKDTDHTVNS